MSLHILLVDDETLVVRAASRALRIRGYTVTSAFGGEEALEVLDRERVDVLLSDVWMPGTDGFALLQAAKARYPDLPVVLFSGASFPELEDRARAEGVAAFLNKPLDVASLIPVLEAAVRGDHEPGA